MKHFRRAALALLCLAVAWGHGVVSHDKRWFPAPQTERALRRAIWWLRPERGFRDTTGRTAVACEGLRGERTAVLLTLGQSNAANEGSLAPVETANVFNFNFFDGRCYEARDPLLGTTGNGSSPWIRVARGLVAAGRFDRVVIVPIAVGGSGIRHWAPDGYLFPRIGRAKAALDAAGLAPTHVLWHQGESDVARDPALYVGHFRAILAGMRELGIDAPVWVAQATLCGNHGSEALRAAQRELADTLPGVRRGPNTDTLDRFAWRRDLCHFSAEGLDRHAQLWLAALRRRIDAGPP